MTWADYRSALELEDDWWIPTSAETTVLTLGKWPSAASGMDSLLLFTPAGALLWVMRPWRQSTRSGGLLSFPFYFNALLLILTALFLHLVPPPQPATTTTPPLLLWNCFSPVFLLMLRGLWTAASIFTPRSVASLRATQIFRGTRAHLEYWWTPLCTLQTDVSSLGQTRAGDTVCEPCYGTGCKKWLQSCQQNGLCHFITVRDGYRCKVQGLPFIFLEVVGVDCPALSLVTVAIVKAVTGVAQGFVLKFTVRSRRDNKTVTRRCMYIPSVLKRCWLRAQRALELACLERLNYFYTTFIFFSGHDTCKWPVSGGSLTKPKPRRYAWLCSIMQTLAGD